MKTKKLISKAIFLAISLGLFLSFECLASTSLDVAQEEVNILPTGGEPEYFAVATDGYNRIYVAYTDTGSPDGDKLCLIQSSDFGQTWKDKQPVPVCNRIGNKAFYIGIDSFKKTIYAVVFNQRMLPEGGYDCGVELYESADDSSFTQNTNLPPAGFYTSYPIKGNETVKLSVDPEDGSVLLSIAVPSGETDSRIYETKTKDGLKFSPWEQIAQVPMPQERLIKAVTNKYGETLSVWRENGKLRYKTSGSGSGHPTFTITASAQGGGAITPSGPVSVEFGHDQTFTFTADRFYELKDVLVDGVSEGNVLRSHTFTNVQANHTITAIFSSRPLSFVITAEAVGNGTINPSGLVPVNFGGDQTFTITPDIGYVVADVIVDGKSVGPVTSYPFTEVQADHTITASFAIKKYTIDASADAGGTISPSGKVVVTSWTNQSFTITPNTGYKIADVEVDGKSVGAPSSYEFTVVTDNHTIRASFTSQEFTITVLAGPNGSIHPGTISRVPYDASHIFAIKPDPGYEISYVEVDWSYVGAISSYHFTNITANHTISATFRPIMTTYTINTIATPADGGTFMPQNPVVFHGSDRTIFINPKPGWAISDVKVDGSSQGVKTAHRFENVTANHTLEAFFVAQDTITATAGDGGSIWPSGTITVNKGATVQFTVTAYQGKVIDTITIDGNNDIIQGRQAQCARSLVGGVDHSIHATFASAAHIIQTTRTAGGSIDPYDARGVTIDHNASKTFGITPDNGYKIQRIEVDGMPIQAVPSTGSCSYTFYFVRKDHTLYALFTQECPQPPAATKPPPPTAWGPRINWDNYRR